MTPKITIGEPRFVGDEIRIRVSGVLGTDTLEEFQRTIEPLLRPPWITLDMDGATIQSKGLKKLLELQTRHPKCQIRLVNVNPSGRGDFERLQGKDGMTRVEYKAEVA